MLLFALTDELVSPDDVQAWIADHDVDSEDGVEAMIAWLRQFRPRSLATIRRRWPTPPDQVGCIRRTG
jgi:hypothetical protein